ncbi:MAG: hypothetical protein MUE31_13910 [Candidatus Nanopelagicales bacterium]|nr:hypothetical protein [Candidatus Nanopelagicales bacterium]
MLVGGAPFGGVGLGLADQQVEQPAQLPGFDGGGQVDQCRFEVGETGDVSGGVA